MPSVGQRTRFRLQSTRALGGAMKRELLRLAIIALLLCVLSFPVQAQVSFVQPPLYSGGGYAQFIADFNGDGKPDILTSDGTLNLGNGDGTFTLGTSLSSTSVPIRAVADFNGDGKPDVLEFNYNNGMLMVLLGNGDGTFQAPISTFANANLQVFAAADVNGDGIADVVAVFTASVYVYINNGDGTFKPGVTYPLGGITAGFESIQFGDFNGDGKTDIEVELGSPSEQVVFLGNGDGTFQTPPKTSASVTFGEYVAVGDFNSDGKLDLVISQPPCVISESCEVYVQLGNGDGTFQAPVAAFPGTGALAAADLNGDGRMDLALVSSLNPLTAQIYLGNGDATFSSPISYGVSLGGGGGAGGNAISIADFNGDGKLDIAAGGILLGNGDVTFKGIPLAVLPNFPIAIAVGDFEKKGAQDVAALSGFLNASQTANLYVLSNNDKGALSLIQTYALQQDDAAIVTADLNGDGQLDLALLGIDPTTQNWVYSVMLGNGDGSFQSPVIYPQSGPSPNTLVVADFNGDHKPDLAFGFGSNTSASSDSVAILLGNGDATFAPPVYYYNAGGYEMVVADFNGDGKLDIVAGNGILYGKGDGTFQNIVFTTGLNNFSPSFTADFNNDGKPDVCCPVALGNGDGTFTQLPPTTLPSGFGPTVVADLNGDGKLDLLGTFTYTPPGDHPTNTAISLGNGDGTFESLMTLTPGVMAFGLGAFSAVLAVDMNGDGQPDIVFPWVNYAGICSACVGTPTGVAVLLNTTHVGAPQPDFQMFASGLSPTPVVTGSSATSTITVAALNGFTGDVALSCTGLPTGTGCSFNPASITGGSGTSTLTVTTASSLAGGSYTVTVSGVSGTISRIVALTLTVESGTTLDFQISATAPAALGPGSSATSMVTVAALNGFNSAVVLTCNSGVSSVTCSLNPTTVTPSGGTSPTATLTISTTTAASLGTHSVTLYGTSGSDVHSIGVTVNVQPDFTIGAASGSPTSQTISAGQTASFSVAIAPSGSFTGMVNLSCAITPAVTPAPICSLSNSSVQISGSGTQSVTVKVATTAASSGTALYFNIPPGTVPLTWCVMLLGSTWLWVQNRRRLPALAKSILVLATVFSVGCGSSGSPHTTPGTPAGNYTATITASSGSQSHNMALQVVVQ